ncbi:amidohydrolase [Brevibacillus invocatus]|uniref:amidohydrolase n=1 Tax=Brevibacillus invocatus TaxID=173959 RepID=UPI00203C2C18|nr:amidohydrolase [Brevibacillus invocatus]MCM3080632.1 amidohydrolase [Brevibacillus invocatus]MCM3432523.1 amidohydrolase [Brevibacillus invocatus]
MQTTVTEHSAEKVREQVIQWRRYLHQHPELSFQEEKTSDFVYDTLHSFGNLLVTRPTKTSVMARLIGSQPGKCIALRADMDALPIQEENTFSYASQNPGVMHACGHDGHTAMLLGTAKVLSEMKDQIKGEIRFFFQHAEELFPGGASEMVAAGVMDGVDVVLGAHVLSTLEIGKIGITYGPMLAAPDVFKITVIGKGGHAAHPHQVPDSVAIAAQLVTNLQHIVSRNVDPLDSAVLSVTQLISGTTHNVIPGTAYLCGTVRTFTPELREKIPQRIEQIVKGITEAHEATYEFTYEKGYAALINDEKITKTIEASIIEIFGESAVEYFKPCMGGEDFSAYMEKAPGSYITLGAGNAAKGITNPHHHPRFDFDEAALDNGLKILLHSTLSLMNQ